MDEDARPGEADEPTITKDFRFTRLEQVEVPLRLLGDDPDGTLAEEMIDLARATLEENLGSGIAGFFEIEEVS